MLRNFSFEAAEGRVVGITVTHDNAATDAFHEPQQIRQQISRSDRH
jgi:hypothetical protein